MMENYIMGTGRCMGVDEDKTRSVNRAADKGEVEGKKNAAAAAGAASQKWWA